MSAEKKSEKSEKRNGRPLNRFDQELIWAISKKTTVRIKFPWDDTDWKYFYILHVDTYFIKVQELRGDPVHGNPITNGEPYWINKSHLATVQPLLKTVK